MGFLKKGAVVLAIITPMLGIAGPTAALADTLPVSDAVAVVGTGTIAPGLPTTGCQSNQHVNFSGTLTVTAGDETSTTNISFDGNSDICETLNAGHGSGTLAGGASGTVTYSRTGNVVTITGSPVINGEGHSVLAAACVFIPTSANPVSSYALACAAALTS
jgi:hypothetical protein